MGTNYYVREQTHNKCEHCGRGEEYNEIHIGKSSMGWQFLFNSNEGRFKNYDQIKAYLKKHEHHIYNEYSERVSLYDFISLVDQKQSGMDLKDYYQKYPKHNVFGADPSMHEYHDQEGYRFHIGGEFS